MKSRSKSWQECFIPEPNSGCWLWEGGYGRHGYGVVRIRGTAHGVHRLAWETAYGPIPDGMHVCHHCDVRACGNPEHLFLGTAKDNTQDALRKGRLSGWLLLHAGKTHCPHGHEYTPENTRILHGKRTCRQCKNEQQRRYYASKVRHG